MSDSRAWRGTMLMTKRTGWISTRRTRKCRKAIDAGSHQWTSSMATSTGRRGSMSNRVVSSDLNSSTSSRSEAAVASGWRIIERARSLIGASAWICATNCSRTPNVDEVSWRAPRARSTRTSARRA